MIPGLLEILGIFAVLVGVIAVVGAAALISVPLAVLTAGLFLLLIGVLAIYAALQLEKRSALSQGPIA